MYQPQNCKCKFEIIHSVCAFKVCLFIRFVCCKRRRGWSWDCRDTTSHGAPTEGPHDLTRLSNVCNLFTSAWISIGSLQTPTSNVKRRCTLLLSLIVIVISSLVKWKLWWNVFCYLNLVYQLTAICKHVQQIYNCQVSVEPWSWVCFQRFTRNCIKSKYIFPRRNCVKPTGHS